MVCYIRLRTVEGLPNSIVTGTFIDDYAEIRLRRPTRKRLTGFTPCVHQVQAEATQSLFRRVCLICDIILWPSMNPQPHRRQYFIFVTTVITLVSVVLYDRFNCNSSWMALKCYYLKLLSLYIDYPKMWCQKNCILICLI